MESAESKIELIYHAWLSDKKFTGWRDAEDIEPFNVDKPDKTATLLVCRTVFDEEFISFEFGILRDVCIHIEGDDEMNGRMSTSDDDFRLEGWDIIGWRK